MEEFVRRLGKNWANPEKILTASGKKSSKWWIFLIFRRRNFRNMSQQAKKTRVVTATTGVSVLNTNQEVFICISTTCHHLLLSHFPSLSYLFFFCTTSKHVFCFIFCGKTNGNFIWCWVPGYWEIDLIGPTFKPRCFCEYSDYIY